MSDRLETATAQKATASETVWVEDSAKSWAARKIDEFFEHHPNAPILELRDHSVLSFFRLPTPGNRTDAEVITYLHDKVSSRDKAARLIFGKTVAEYQREQHWFVRRPEGDVECFLDELDDERSLEEAGDYAAILALREQKRRAAVDPANHSPIEEPELEMLSMLLKNAERRLPSY